MIYKYIKNDLFFYLLLFLIIFFFLFFRIYINKISNLGLHFDEAQYWSWSREFNWGYFSKPPLISWLISLSTSFCGIEEYCIRLFSPLLHSFTALTLGLSARILIKNNYFVLFTVILYLLMPGVVFSSFFITTDVPLLFFSSLITFCLVYLFSKKNSNLLIWLLLSISIGLGFLSKYALIYYIVGIIVALVLLPDLRNVIINKRFFFLIIISLLIFSPNIIWNLQNGLVTFNHTADNGNFNNINLSITRTLKYLIEQSVIFGMIPFGLILFKIAKIKSINNIRLFLLIIFLTPIIIVSILGFFTRINSNWGIVGFPAGCLLVSVFIYDIRKKWIVYSVFLTQIFLTFTISYLLLFGFEKKIDPFYKYRTISKLGIEVGKVIIKYPEANFICDDREDYSYMLYYLDPKPRKMAKWNGNDRVDDHYDLVTDTDSLAGKDIILLTRTAPTPSMLARASGYEKIKEIRLFIGQKKVRIYNLFLLKDWVITSEGKPGAKR